VALTAAGKNAMLDGLAGAVGYVSLHSSDPSTNGANEISGGSPAYARKAVSWGAAASASVTSDANVVFDVPGSTTITHLGYWSAATSGTFYGYRQLDTNQTFATQGTYTISSGNLTESVS
jgi:hypothetical protein